MKTLIPKLLEIKPGFVFWQQGELPEPKSVELELDVDGAEIVSAEVARGDNLFSAQLVRSVEDPRKYSLMVFPHKVDEPARGTIAVRLDYPAENPKTFYVYAQVK